MSGGGENRTDVETVARLAATAPATSVNPLRNPSFRRLFAAQVVALVGTGLSTVALTLLAYDLSGGHAAIVLSTALACKMIAYVFFAPIVGGLAHRFPRKPFLIGTDIVRAGIVLLMPYVTQFWQIYLLIFLLNLFSAGFKPVFAATIPDILPDEREYTRALAYSRLGYDLETLLSPLLAGIALLVVSYSGLFAANSIAFLLSALMIVVTSLPKRQAVVRLGGVVDEVLFGVRSYFKTPRLRSLLTLYLAVASASAMVIVNTVIYIRDDLQLGESNVAMALAATGCGAMVAALSVPRLLDRISDRLVMLMGGAAMAIGLLLMASGPSFMAVLPTWFVVGLGLSLVQTPAARIVNRSAAPADRPAYFSAQFSLSHACWLIFYIAAGQLMARFGFESTAVMLGIGIAIFTGVAALSWPFGDQTSLVHEHSQTLHEHSHTHGPHHSHEHAGDEGTEPHSHLHRHAPTRHEHDFVIDAHHTMWPNS